MTAAPPVFSGYTSLFAGVAAASARSVKKQKQLVPTSSTFLPSVDRGSVSVTSLRAEPTAAASS